MKIPDFELERWKSKFIVPGVIDLTETGIPEPLKLKDILREDGAQIHLGPRTRDELLQDAANA